MTWTGTVIANHLYNADDEFDDIIVELPPPWDSWLDIVVTGYPDGRDPESVYRGCRNAELFGSISSNARRADCTTPLRSTIHPLAMCAWSRSSSSRRRSAAQTYTPARFEIEESQQSGTPVIDATVKLREAVVGHQSADETVEGCGQADGHHGHAGRYSTAETCLCRLSPGSLYVKTVDIDADAASVTLSVTNPLNNNIGKLYDPREYTGLQYL